jgi:hypothetical protein
VYDEDTNSKTKTKKMMNESKDNNSKNGSIPQIKQERRETHEVLKIPNQRTIVFLLVIIACMQSIHIYTVFSKIDVINNEMRNELTELYNSKQHHVISVMGKSKSSVKI